MPINLKTITIKKAQDALRNGEYTSHALTEAVLTEAKKKNPEINAYAEIFDDAMQCADEADKKIKLGQALPLTGIPVAIKDNMLYRGHESTSGSKILRGHIATYSGMAVEKLLAQDAVIVGRTNMDEFAMGSSSETCAYGIVKNPVDITRIPGGSSGGAAAALKMDGALGTFGSDTGGSIRQPASLTGLVGLKPTYGAVSRSGLMALASSFDQIGPFGKTVGDAKILFDAIAGHDPMDSTTVPAHHDLRKQSIKKEQLTIGVPEAFIAMDGIDDDVRVRFRETIAELKRMGHTVVSVDLPLLPKALAVYYIIQPAEASANLARFDGIRYGFSKDAERLIDVYRQSRGEGFGKEVRRRILLGTYVLSTGYYDAYYNKAVAVRRQITSELDDVFQKVDAIATPTTPSPAWKLGAKSADPIKMYLEDIFTVPANIAGIPALSVPSGVVVRGGASLPLGIQFMGAHFQEDTLFQIGKSVEKIYE